MQTTKHNIFGVLFFALLAIPCALVISFSTDNTSGIKSTTTQRIPSQSELEFQVEKEKHQCKNEREFKYSRIFKVATVKGTEEIYSDSLPENAIEDICKKEVTNMFGEISYSEFVGCVQSIKLIESADSVRCWN